MYNFQLILELDDDCRVYYQDKAYCRYQEDLCINQRVQNKEEALAIVQSIDVAHGYKGTETVKEYLDSLAAYLTGENNLAPHSHSGNWEMYFDFYELTPKENQKEVHLTHDGDSIELEEGIVKFYALNRSVDEPSFTIMLNDLSDFVKKVGK